jgi:hypothetical protein
MENQNHFYVLRYHLLVTSISKHYHQLSFAYHHTSEQYHLYVKSTTDML